MTLTDAQLKQRSEAGKARAKQPSFQEHNKHIAPLGGQATLAKHGVAHYRRIGKMGLQALADKRFGGDLEQAMAWLIGQGLKARW
jgi:hypothetical protein